MTQLSPEEEVLKELGSDVNATESPADQHQGTNGGREQVRKKWAQSLVYKMRCILLTAQISFTNKQNEFRPCNISACFVLAAAGPIINSNNNLIAGDKVRRIITRGKQPTKRASPQSTLRRGGGQESQWLTRLWCSLLLQVGGCSSRWQTWGVCGCKRALNKTLVPPAVAKLTSIKLEHFAEAGQKESKAFKGAILGGTRRCCSFQLQITKHCWPWCHHSALTSWSGYAQISWKWSGCQSFFKVNLWKSSSDKNVIIELKWKLNISFSLPTCS